MKGWWQKTHHSRLEGRGGTSVERSDPSPGWLQVTVDGLGGGHAVVEPIVNVESIRELRSVSRETQPGLNGESSSS